MTLSPRPRSALAGYPAAPGGLYEPVRGAFDAVADPLIGALFQRRYRIEARLGQGGFGTVYRATQVSIRRPVAIKILHRELGRSPTEIARFQQEARAAAAIAHPNVVVVHDFGRADEGSLFMVTELLAGETLTDLIRREGPLAPERVVGIGLQVLEGLHAAHQVGVVHRDLRPENLFVSPRRGGAAIKILDFGIAKVVGEAAAPVTLTQSGYMLGSPAYMAPEQSGTGAVGPTTDLYALGAILYEALCGRRVYERDTPAGYVTAHAREPAPPCIVGRALVEGPLVDFIERCLAKRQSDRPATAAAALRELRACRERPLTREVSLDRGQLARLTTRPVSNLPTGLSPVGPQARVRRPWWRPLLRSRAVRTWLLPAAVTVVVLGLLTGWFIGLALA